MIAAAGLLLVIAVAGVGWFAASGSMKLNGHLAYPGATPSSVSTATPDPGVKAQDIVLTLKDVGAGFEVDTSRTQGERVADALSSYRSAFAALDPKTGFAEILSLATVYTTQEAAELDVSVTTDGLKSRGCSDNGPPALSLANAYDCYQLVSNLPWHWLAWRKGNVALTFTIEYTTFEGDPSTFLPLAQIMDRRAAAAGGVTPGPAANPTTGPAPPSGQPGPSSRSSCFGCVTFTSTSLRISVVGCYNATKTITGSPPGQVIGPNVNDPHRIYVSKWTVDMPQVDGCPNVWPARVALGSATYSPVEIQQYSPSPLQLPALRSTTIYVYIHVPNGNFYDGALNLDLYV